MKSSCSNGHLTELELTGILLRICADIRALALVVSCKAGFAALTKATILTESHQYGAYSGHLMRQFSPYKFMVTIKTK